MIYLRLHTNLEKQVLRSAADADHLEGTKSLPPCFLGVGGVNETVYFSTLVDLLFFVPSLAALDLMFPPSVLSNQLTFEQMIGLDLLFALISQFLPNNFCFRVVFSLGEYKVFVPRSQYGNNQCGYFLFNEWMLGSLFDVQRIGQDQRKCQFSIDIYSQIPKVKVNTYFICFKIVVYSYNWNLKLVQVNWDLRLSVLFHCYCVTSL